MVRDNQADFYKLIDHIEKFYRIAESENGLTAGSLSDSGCFNKELCNTAACLAVDDFYCRRDRAEKGDLVG